MNPNIDRWKSLIARHDELIEAFESKRIRAYAGPGYDHEQSDQMAAKLRAINDELRGLIRTLEERLAGASG